MVFEVLCGTCGGGIFLVRQRNLSKHCLLRFLGLNIKIFYRVFCEDFQELQQKIGPSRAFVLKYTVTPAYVATCIKASPALSSHIFGSLVPKYSVDEPVLRGHLS